MNLAKPVLKPQRGLDPNVRQRQASDPGSSVWVGASAGTGKTKVLTDRVLRLLLPREDGQAGTNPSKILCLTFTKSAAGEMALRISETLADWAVLPEEKLEESLRNLLGRAASKEEKAASRRLFAETIDAPGGMNIMTVHAFCQSVLARFPLEAGIAPGFKTLEEAQAEALLAEARRQVSMTEGEASQALKNLGGAINEDQFAALLRNIAGERGQFEELLREKFGAEGIYTSLCAQLGIKPGLSAQDYLRAECADGAFDKNALMQAADGLLASTSAGDQARGEAVKKWLGLDAAARAAYFDAYKSAYLKADGEILKKLAVKAVAEKHLGILEVLGKEAERVYGLAGHIKAIESAALTRDLFILAQAVLEQYADLKAAQGALDFDDLILKTCALIKAQPGWVHYKLDEGLEHILIDEAQDTNPEQWQIVDALCSEFYAGAGAAEAVRTVFTVGDEKQSIYSFQRASPEEFFRMRADFRMKITQAGLGWADVDLNISFRSVQAVLDVVDAVFPGAAHHSFRTGQGGRVQLWPVFETQEEAEEAEGWPLPQIRTRQSGAGQSCDFIAGEIRRWLDEGEILEPRGRAVRPGDIMILVRTRNAFVQQLARSLKNKNIPLSGVDRLVLSEDIAVQDLLAAAEFALLPGDDLTLACLLKSPLVGLSEDDLFALAQGRASSLYETVRRSEYKDIAAYLESLIKARSLAPYDFLMLLLHKPCPADERSGLRAVKKRLGADALDPVEELLNMALGFEQEEGARLQEFVQRMRGDPSIIKREHEEGGDAVRIMTVHGAKGLQAPIVILPDALHTGISAPGKADAKLLWPDKTGLEVPLWAPNADFAYPLFRDSFESLKERDEAEYRRLLYVAMTRAEDRLYIGGYVAKKKPMAGSWYNLVQAGLESLAETESAAGGLVYETRQVREADRAGKQADSSEMLQDLPGWFLRQAPEEPDPPAPLTPSRPSEVEPGILSPLKNAQAMRFLRGNLTHRLLEILPDLPYDKRRTAAQSYLVKNGQDISESVRESILEEIFKILENPVFAPIFGPGSQAEVPVTGVLAGRVMSGQIDRLLVTDQEILIVDYKTNRPPPKDVKDVPLIYHNQMKAYAAALAGVYPGRSVKCALLWTDGPYLMPITFGT